MKWDFVTPSLFMASSNNGKLNPDVLDADCGIWFLVFGFRRRSMDPIFYWRKSHGAASPVFVLKTLQRRLFVLNSLNSYSLPAKALSSRLKPDFTSALLL